MKQKFFESPILFLTLFKWCVLASGIGLLVGTSTTLFLASLNRAIQFTHRSPYYFWLLPITLPLSQMLIERFAPEAEGYGAKVIEAIHKFSGRIPPLVAPVKFVTTLLTIAFGGSAGKTGPGVQIGAGLTSICASWLHINDADRRKMVSCAISAGFAATFGTSITGAIFGSEVLYIGALFYDVLFPSFIAGIVAQETAAYLGMLYPASPRFPVPPFHGVLFLKLVAGGIVFGLGALLLIESLHFAENLARRIPVWPPLKGILGGFVLIALTYLFSDQYLGLGTSTIEACLQGKLVAPAAFAIKIVFVVITLHFCGSGGIITPMLFIGATLGNAFGQLMRMNPAFFSALGMASLLAGAANTPLTAILMATELFTPEIAPYAAIASLTSFLMAGHRTVYPSQVLYITKSAFLDIETHKEVSQIDELYITPHRTGIVGVIVGWIQKRNQR